MPACPKRTERRGRASRRAAVRAANEVGAERHQEPATQVVPKCDGADELNAAAPFLLGHGKRRGHCGTPGMSLCDRLEIVGLVGVRAHGVGERGIDRRRPEAGADHRRLRLAPEPLDILHCNQSRAQSRARDHRPERIQDVVLAFGRHGVRQRTVACFDHVARQLRGHAIRGLCCCAAEAMQCCNVARTPVYCSARRREGGRRWDMPVGLGRVGRCYFRSIT